MRFLRNTEFRVELILLTILFVAAIIGMYMQCGTIAAVYLLIFCGVIFCLYISYSVVKYRKMASLAEQIDRILHGEELQIMEHCCEGEFAVLATSIDKMVQRMLEQQSILQKRESIFGRFYGRYFPSDENSVDLHLFTIEFIAGRNIFPKRNVCSMCKI